MGDIVGVWRLGINRCEIFIGDDIYVFLDNSNDYIGYLIFIIVSIRFGDKFKGFVRVVDMSSKMLKVRRDGKLMCVVVRREFFGKMGNRLMGVFFGKRYVIG